jgi:hypothetical protein
MEDPREVTQREKDPREILGPIAHIYRSNLAYMAKELESYRVGSGHFRFLPFSQKLYEPGFNLPSDCLNEMQ